MSFTARVGNIITNLTKQVNTTLTRFCLINTDEEQKFEIYTLLSEILTSLYFDEFENSSKLSDVKQK